MFTTGWSTQAWPRRESCSPRAPQTSWREGALKTASPSPTFCLRLCLLLMFELLAERNSASLKDRKPDLLSAALCAVGRVEARPFHSRFTSFLLCSITHAWWRTRAAINTDNILHKIFQTDAYLSLKPWVFREATFSAVFWPLLPNIYCLHSSSLFNLAFFPV